MSPDLFRQIVETRRSTTGTRLSALPLSIIAHALVLAALVVIPLLASDVLPLVHGNEIIIMPAVVAPTPPTAPAATPQRPPSSELVNANLAPTTAPNGFSRERMVQAEPTVESAAPEDRGGVPGGGIPGGTNMVETEPPLPRPAAPIHVSRLSKAPVKIRDVSPVYPTIAIASHVEGIVIIEAVIGPTGEVTEARVIRSKPLLDEAAVAAVRQWRYTPTLLNGVPVPVILTVTVTFSLR